MKDPINVVLFGEIGAGKSSIINLIAQKEIAKVSSDAARCTTRCQRYDIFFDDTDFAIFDTIGIGITHTLADDLKAVENGYELVSSLEARGGVHFLLFCMRSGQITETLRSFYRLVRECLCGTYVSIALVITHLEREEEMEDWWRGHKNRLEEYGIKSDGHACVTARHIPGREQKYLESQKIIREMLKSCARTEDIQSPDSWFARGAKSTMHMKNLIQQKKVTKKRDVMNLLTIRCRLDVESAKGIVGIIEKIDMESANGLVQSEKAFRELRAELADSKRETTRLSKILDVHHLKHRCESVYSDGHVVDSARLLLEITKSIDDDVKTDTIITDWLLDFKGRCIPALEQIGDVSKNHDEALAAYSIALFICPTTPLLTKWASQMLVHASINETLNGTKKFKLPKFTVYSTVCDVLEKGGRILEAVGCFQLMENELTSGWSVHGEWELDFRLRCARDLKKLVGIALCSQNYKEADKHYSTILSLDPPDRVDILIKRSEARVAMTLWTDALNDANKAIDLDPSSHLGYEQKHGALHGAKRYKEAVATFDTILLKLKKSPHNRVYEVRPKYTDARPVIRRTIQKTISRMPPVLIDTATGRLLNRERQAQEFELLPIFDELVSSMTKQINEAWIRKEVKAFYQYVMLSHKWEDGEPLFQDVMPISVEELKASRGNIKLKNFCSLARSLMFRWAWSDTCCIDKKDNVVLQESLVAMFSWYRDSSLTIIHLCDVESLSEEPDGLKWSIWNTRVWTYQEYVAAKRVRFYTSDWKPYLGLELANHKESPMILRQMELPQVSADQVAILRPGLDRVREKLFLASTRETTLVEDIAYSLLGILNASIPVIYGEGTRAVGRLLEYVLTGSGDITILAWTGTANNYNSCLPLNLTVYNELVPPHIPHMETSELDRRVAELRSSILDLSLATTLYDRLKGLPAATIASSRLRLPCVLIRITKIVLVSGPGTETNLYIYHATTDMLGDVEIKTTCNLTVKHEHCFVHPWTRPLLEQEHVRGTAGLDSETRALRLVARLRQRFGALLFEKVSWVDYKRVAAGALIMAQFRDEGSLTQLMDNIETIEVL